MYDVPLPVLLNGSMQEVARIHPSKVSISLQLSPLSTSTIELPKGMEIPQRAWVKLYTSAGFAGVFRAHSPAVDCATGGSTVVVEHGVCEIGDYLITTDLKVNGTAAEVFADIMEYYGGSLWQLGTVEPTTTIKAESDHGNVLEALLEAMEALPGYMMTFDQSTLPWTLNVVSRPSTVTGEGRLSRNVQSATITPDDSELCTRVYMDKLTNGYLDADTLSIYGPIEHRIEGDDDLTAAEALTIAQAYLDKRKSPVLSVNISLVDLSMITGESLDEIHCGQMYRLVTPDGTIVTQTVVSVSYNDVYGAPLSAQVVLAEEADTMSSVAAGLQLQMSKVTHAYYRLNKAIIGDEESLTILANDISLVAGDLQNTRIDLDAQGIRLSTVESTTTAMSTTLDRAGINLSAQNGISLYADHTELNRVSGIAASNTAELTVQAGQIAGKVSSGDVATELSIELGNVSISGGNLVVSGYILSSELETEIAAISELNLHDLVANEAGITTLTAGSLYVTGSTSLGSVTVNGTDLESNAVSSIGPASVDSNTGGVSIPWSYLSGSSGTPVTFNIASTVYFQQAVAAAAAAVTVSGSWATNMFTATASNGQGAVGSFTVGDITSTTVNPNDGHYLTGTVPITLVGGGSTSYTPTVNIDATPAYNAGVASVPTVNVVKGSWSGGNITFSPSSGSGTSASVSLLGTHGVYDATNKKYTVTIWDGDTSHGTGCQVPVNASGAYAAGWAAARALISTSDNKIYGPPATVDGSAEVVYTITSGVSSGSIYWQGTRTARCDMVGYAYINGDAVRSSSRSQVNSLP